MPYVVTVKADLVDVMLPNGQRAQGGDTAVLTDAQFAAIPGGNFISGALSGGSGPTYVTSYAATTVAANTLPYLSGYSATNDPQVGQTQVGSTTTPYSDTEANDPEFLEES